MNPRLPAGIVSLTLALFLVGGCGGNGATTLPASFGLPQAPALAGVGTAISSSDRVYTANQKANTVSVVDPSTNTLVGTVELGKSQSSELFSALYKEQVGVHGLGFSPDGSLLAVVSVTSNALTILETATNAVRGSVYLGRAPHEGFFTPDGRQVWVAVRGQDYVSVVDVTQMKEAGRITTSDGVAMVIFRPDGKVAFINSSRTAQVDIVDVSSRKVIKSVTGLVSPFSPNLAASPDGREVWLTHKDVGKVTILDAQTFAVLGVLSTGKTTNHVNFVSRPEGDFAYVSVGGEDAVKVYRRNGGTPALVATIATGKTPHGIWPSADNTRVYVGLEDANAVQVVETTSNTVIATIPVGDSPQALVYVARRP